MRLVYGEIRTADTSILLEAKPTDYIPETFFNDFTEISMVCSQTPS